MVGTASMADAMTTGAASAAMTSDATVTATRKTVARASAEWGVSETMIGLPSETAADILTDHTRGHCRKWFGVRSTVAGNDRTRFANGSAMTPSGSA